MGNLNSIPILSQVKSLVQVIGGDAEGARKTQEDFIEKGIIASQVTSLVKAANGDLEGARKTQEAFAKELESVVDNLPVVGHVKAGVHAIVGDTEGAERIALGATKSTVILLAGIAGAVCGPAAAVCGGTFAVGATAAWDGVDSGISGETKGLIKGVGDIATGKASIGEGFDTVVGTGLTFAGGAAAAKSFANKVSSGTPRCRRSIPDYEALFDENLPSLDENLLKVLPPTLEEGFAATNSSIMELNPDHFVTTIFSILMVLKLISVGHPNSKPYYDEICGKMYPEQNLDECEVNLYHSLSKFNRASNETLASNTFEDSYETLMFEMKNLLRQSDIGKNLEIVLCFHYENIDIHQECVAKMNSMLKKIKGIFHAIDDTRIRRKRSCVDVMIELHERLGLDPPSYARPQSINVPHAASGVGAVAVSQAVVPNPAAPNPAAPNPEAPNPEAPNPCHTRKRRQVSAPEVDNYLTLGSESFNIRSNNDVLIKPNLNSDHIIGYSTETVPTPNGDLPSYERTKYILVHLDKSMSKNDYQSIGEGTTTDSRTKVHEQVSDSGRNAKLNNNNRCLYDCGHIVPKALGGTVEDFNTFPQDSNINRGEWAQAEKQLRNTFFDNDNYKFATVEYKLVYDDTIAPTIPSKIEVVERYFDADKRLEDAFFTTGINDVENFTWKGRESIINENVDC